VRPPKANRGAAGLLMGLLKLDTRLDRATLLVVNGKGKSRVLFYEDHPEEADAKRQRVEDELRDLGLADWCERYDVPISFVTGNR
jgi:hypothetical protein